MDKKEITFLSADGKTDIVMKMWTPDGDPRGIVQLVHGMVEFIDRFDGFARYLTQAGFVVFGHDQLAHGDSVTDPKEWGYLPFDKGYGYLLADIDHIRVAAQQAYGDDLPYFLFGHSMGSFEVRNYASNHGAGLSGLIVSGTGQQTSAMCKMGNFIPRAIGAFRGQHYRSKFVNDMALGGYNKSFEPARTPYDWLTHDEAIVDAYAANPKNTFMFTVGGYENLTALIATVIGPACFENTPDDLPIFIASGEEDPVGDFGKAPRAVADLYREHGCNDVTLKLYPGDRHEILNELDRDQVRADMLAFIESHMDVRAGTSHDGMSAGAATVEPAVDAAEDPAVDTAEDPAVDAAEDPAVGVAGEPAVGASGDPAVAETEE